MHERYGNTDSFGTVRVGAEMKFSSDGVQPIVPANGQIAIGAMDKANVLIVCTRWTKQRDRQEREDHFAIAVDTGAVEQEVMTLDALVKVDHKHGAHLEGNARLVLGQQFHVPRVQLLQMVAIVQHVVDIAIVDEQLVQVVTGAQLVLQLGPQMELNLEAIVGTSFGKGSENKEKGILVVQPISSHQIGHDDGGRTRLARSAIDQNFLTSLDTTRNDVRRLWKVA